MLDCHNTRVFVADSLMINKMSETKNSIARPHTLHCNLNYNNKNYNVVRFSNG